MRKRSVFVIWCVMVLLTAPGAGVALANPVFLGSAQSLCGTGATGEDVAVEPVTGDLVVVGSFAGVAYFESETLDATNRGQDIFVARYDRHGNLRWVEQAGGTGIQDKALAVCVDSSGNAFVTGGFLGSATFGTGGGAVTLASEQGKETMFVAKYDDTGSLVWAVKAPGPGCESQGRAICMGPGGTFFVAGRYLGNDFLNNLYSAGNFFDAFVAQFNASGIPVWSQTGGGPNGMDQANALAVDSAGNVYYAGEYAETAVFGSLNAVSEGGTDIFVAAYDDEGDFINMQSAGGAGDDTAWGVALDAAGNLDVTGYVTGAAYFDGTTLNATAGTDMYVARYDSGVNFLNAFMVNASGAAEGRAICVDADGMIVVAGGFAGTAAFGAGALNSSGGADVFLAAFDAAGVNQYALKAGGAGDETALSVAPLVSGGAAISGVFEQVAVFGSSHVATHAANGDAFLAEIGSPAAGGGMDFNGDGRLGLDDALGILQVTSGLR